MIGGPSKFWVLPPEIMDGLQKTFGFDYDPCPFAGGLVKFDGLSDMPEDKRCAWVNPLFGRGITRWVRWSIRQAKRGKTVVLILPLDNWVKLLLGQIFGGTYGPAGEFGEIVILGSHDWLNPETGERRKSSRPSFLFILKAVKPSVQRSPP